MYESSVVYQNLHAIVSKEYNIYKNSWYWKMVNEMKDLLTTTPFYPDKMLFDIAKKHAIDMGMSGKKGHRNSQGELNKDRIAELKKEFVLIKENIQYGYLGSICNSMRFVY